MPQVGDTNEQIENSDKSQEGDSRARDEGHSQGARNRRRMDRRSQTRPAETRRVDGSFTVHNGHQTEKTTSLRWEGGKTTRVVLRVRGGQSMQRRQVSRLEDSRGYSMRNDGHNEGSVTG